MPKPQFSTLPENLIARSNLLREPAKENALVYHLSFIYKLSTTDSPTHRTLFHIFLKELLSFSLFLHRSVSSGAPTHANSCVRAQGTPTLLPSMPLLRLPGPCQCCHLSEVHLIVHILYTGLPIYSSSSSLLPSPHYLNGLYNERSDSNPQTFPQTG